MLPGFQYIRPKSLKEAIKCLSSEGALVYAGGTDVLGCLREGVFKARSLVSISHLKELHGISESAGGLRLGALTTISEVAASPLVNKRFRALAQGALEVASPQLRNQGTIGGNLCQKPRCWYYRGEFHCLRKGGDLCFAPMGENRYHAIFGGAGCYIVHPSDTAPALMALGAFVRIAGPGETRRVPVDQFFVGPATDVRRETVVKPAEIVTEVLLPPPPIGLRSSYRKVRARRSWDFALAGVAMALQFSGDRVTGGRIVLSGVAPVPWRSKEVEEIITGMRLDGPTLAGASDAVAQTAQPLEQNGYKVSLLRGLIREELEKISRA